MKSYPPFASTSFASRLLFVACFAFISAIGHADATKPDLVVPSYKTTELVLASRDFSSKSYLSNPCAVQLNDRELLFTIKRGTSHGWDKEADVEAGRIDLASGRLLDNHTIGHIPNRKFQLTIAARLGNGELLFLSDLQHLGDDANYYRVGMAGARSSDDGRTVGEWKPVGLVDGVEYGYPMDMIVEGNSVYLIAMSFGYRPGDRWSVDVIKSDDNAKTWHFVRSISAELGGAPINESGFAKHGKDFIVVARGYTDVATRVARFGPDFKLKKVSDLTGTPYIQGRHIGWPRVFEKDGGLYLLGRNWTLKPENRKDLQPRSSTYPHLAENQQLCLIKIDPDSLTVRKVVVLDNEGGALPVVDGYYAFPYWTGEGKDTLFSTVTYRSINLTNPDIVRFQFRWNEIR